MREKGVKRKEEIIREMGREKGKGNNGKRKGLREGGEGRLGRMAGGQEGEAQLR